MTGEGAIGQLTRALAIKQSPTVLRTTVALIQKTYLQAGWQEKFVYSHINDCGSIAVAIQDSRIFVQRAAPRYHQSAKNY